MGIQTKREISHGISSQSVMLVKQAKSEYFENGQISVKCPKCGSIPVVEYTANHERMTLRCSCGYIAGGEIYF